MKKEYKNVIVTGLRASQNGHLRSLALDDYAMQRLSQLEKGAQVFIRFRSDEAKSKDKTERSFDAYLEIVPKAEVDAYFASIKDKTGL